MKKHMRSIIAVSATAGLLVLFMGCGNAGNLDIAPLPSQPSTSTPVPPPNFSTQPTTVTCGAGVTTLSGRCFPGLDLSQACASLWGYLTNVGGKSVCRFDADFSFVFSTIGFPWLTPSMPTGPGSYLTAINVRVGDTVSFSGTGGWGGSSTKSFSILGGFLQGYTTSLDCDAIGLNGLKDSEVVTNEGQPAGLYASDGIEAFYVGQFLTGKVIQNAGLLRFGFNAPSGMGSCSTARGSFHLSRCEDGAGNSYRCP